MTPGETGGGDVGPGMGSAALRTGKRHVPKEGAEKPERKHRKVEVQERNTEDVQIENLQFFFLKKASF